MPVFLILLMLWAVPGFGQAPRTTRKPVAAGAKPKVEKAAESAHAWPIGSLKVDGNRIYSSDQILTAAGLKIGQMAGKDEFEAARDRLLATGGFESVGYNFAPAATGSNEFAASFQVVEIAQVFPFRFDALTVDQSALRSFLKQKEPLFDKTLPATKEVLARVARETEEFLAKSGHPEKVVGKLSNEGSKELNVVFSPGNLPSVAEVKFKGNETIPTQTLQQSIAGVAVGSVYSAERFQQLLGTSIRPLYEAKGKIRVVFPKLETEAAKDVNGLIVTVSVVEGPVFNLGKVTLAGVPGATTLLKEAKFKSDEPANFTEIEEGIERIRAALRRTGYMQVKSETERKIDDKEKKVDVVVHVELGALFSFGKLNIEGLDIQSEPQIRKLWTLKPGAPFNAEYPNFFLARVRENGYFDNLGDTKSKLDTDDKSKIVDVTLIFKSDGQALPTIGPARDAIDKKRRKEQGGP
jgi:outer membrane protein insertion porin family